jgi:hypothetical protein
MAYSTTDLVNTLLSAKILQNYSGHGYINIIVHVEATLVWNAGFKMEFGRWRYMHFGLHMYLTSRSLVPRCVPRFWGINVKFQLRFKMVVLQGLIKISIFDRSWEWTLWTNKRETNLLEVRHMATPKFSYPRLNSVLELPFSNVCALPLTSTLNFCWP